MLAKLSWPHLRVAITGASSGIGAATALALAEKGVTVSLGARRTERLRSLAKRCEELGSRQAVWHQLDVTSWESLSKFAQRTKDALGEVDVVIANAGFGNLGNTLDLAPGDVQRLIQTNVTGAIWTVQAFAPQLESRSGQAIVVGSVVSKVAVPYASVYSGSKWALRGWTRGARPELESRGIRLTLFNPGYVRTEFFQQRATAQGVRQWDPNRGFTAEKAAKKMLRAIRRRPAEMEMSLLSRVAIPLYRLMPIQGPRLVARAIRTWADARFTKEK